MFFFQTMKAWDEVLARLTHLDKICPNPPDEMALATPPQHILQSRKRPASSSNDESSQKRNPGPNYMFNAFIQGGSQQQPANQNQVYYDSYGYQYLQSQQQKQKQPLVVRNSFDIFSHTVALLAWFPLVP